MTAGRVRCCKHFRSSSWSSRTEETLTVNWLPEPQLLAGMPRSRPPSSSGDTPARTSSSHTSGWSRPPPSCCRGCPSGHCSGCDRRLSTTSEESAQYFKRNISPCRDESTAVCWCPCVSSARQLQSALRAAVEQDDGKSKVKYHHNVRLKK